VWMIASTQPKVPLVTALAVADDEPEVLSKCDGAAAQESMKTYYTGAWEERQLNNLQLQKIPGR
jgi:hypothetical protein